MLHSERPSSSPAAGPAWKPAGCEVGWGDGSKDRSGGSQSETHARGRQGEQCQLRVPYAGWEFAKCWWIMGRGLLIPSSLPPALPPSAFQLL